MITLLVRILGERQRKHIAALVAAGIACVLAGAALFALMQNLPFTTGLYWTVTTATTVGYGDVTPHNGVGRLIASAVMLTTIPLLAAVFALVAGGAAAAGIRRILNLETRFPEGTYRLVIGMNSTVPAILDELEVAGVPVVLAADVEAGTIRPGPFPDGPLARDRPACGEAVAPMAYAGLRSSSMAESSSIRWVATRRRCSARRSQSSGVGTCRGGRAESASRISSIDSPTRCEALIIATRHSTSAKKRR